LAKTDDEIIVAFGIDANYAPHMAVVVASIIANSPNARFRFMILNDGIPKAEQLKLESVAQGHIFDWCCMDDLRILSLKTKTHVSRASYYRIAIPTVAPENAERVIYLDSDIVVIGDLVDLWKSDLEGKSIGAVFDINVDSVDFAKRWDLAPSRLNYFNAGILVLDLKKIRAENKINDAFDLLASQWDKLVYDDQCLLNVLYWNDWKLLDPVWNFQRNMILPNLEQTSFATPEEIPSGRRPKIVHFTQTNKPWSVDAYHPFVWLYYKYLRRTPYWSQVNRSARTTFMKHLRRFIKTQVSLRKYHRE